jgi:hypothetical protein
MRLPARSALAPLVALSAACSAAPEPAAPPEPTAAPTASAVASATAAPAAPAEIDLPSPYFPKVIHAHSTFRYFPLAKGGVAISGDYYSSPILITEAGARLEPSLYKGLKGAGDPPAFMIQSLSGDWPKSGKLSLNLPGERGGTDVDYTWNGASWVESPAQRFSDMPSEVARFYYTGGLFGTASWGGRPLYYIKVARSEKEPAAPAFRLGGRGGGAAPSPARGAGACPTKLAGYAEIGNLASGDLYGLGKLCTSSDDYDYLTQHGRGGLAIERWRKGSTTSEITVLPGSEIMGSLMHHATEYVEGPGELSWVYATFNEDEKVSIPYIARFDGKAWANVSPPSKQAIKGFHVNKDGSVWIELESEFYRRRGDAWERVAPDVAKGDIQWSATAPDGTLWARFGEDLWHLTSAGTWEKAILPKDGDKQRLAAESVHWLGDEMLILARGPASMDMALFGSKKADKVLDLAAGEGDAPAAKAPAFGRVTPPTPGCKSLFVVLYKLSRVAPPDFDFPLTREALKGHTELADVRFAETEDGGTRYLVAFVPSFARGQKLVKLVEAKVQSSRPQMLCGEPPRTNREIKIDLRTGALVK